MILTLDIGKVKVCKFIAAFIGIILLTAGGKPVPSCKVVNQLVCISYGINGYIIYHGCLSRIVGGDENLLYTVIPCADNH